MKIPTCDEAKKLFENLPENHFIRKEVTRALTIQTTLYAYAFNEKQKPDFNFITWVKSKELQEDQALLFERYKRSSGLKFVWNTILLSKALNDFSKLTRDTTFTFSNIDDYAAFTAGFFGNNIEQAYERIVLQEAEHAMLCDNDVNFKAKYPFYFRKCVHKFLLVLYPNTFIGVNSQPFHHFFPENLIYANFNNFRKEMILMQIAASLKVSKPSDFDRRKIEILDES